MAKSRATSARLDRIARMGCVICRNTGHGPSPAVIHHVRDHGGKRDDSKVLPLCPMHHNLGGYRIAVHAGREAWEAIHGDQTDLLAQVERELA